MRRTAEPRHSILGGALLALGLLVHPVATWANGLASAPAPGATSASLAGERITWSIRYGGVAAGTAWAEAKLEPDGAVVIEGGAKNAPWYGKLYSIDDFVRSTARPEGGSTRYETRFREGGFHQDQDMRLEPGGFEVWRKQRFGEEWREWTKSYDAHPGAEDPISAVTRIRLLHDEALAPTPLGSGWTFPVFSGEKTWPLIVTVVDREPLETEVLGTVQTRVVELRTEHKGMLEQRGRFWIWLTDDARRIPVRMVVKTNFGAVRADLVAYRPPAVPPPAGP